MIGEQLREIEEGLANYKSLKIQLVLKGIENEQWTEVEQELEGHQMINQGLNQKDKMNHS